MNTDLVLQAFEAGDVAVREMIIDTGRHIGRAVAHLASILDIQLIIIAGRLARFGQVLLAAVRDELDCSVLKRISQNTQIELSALEADIVILGAAALVLSRELGVV